MAESEELKDRPGVDLLMKASEAYMRAIDSENLDVEALESALSDLTQAYLACLEVESLDLTEKKKSLQES